MPGRQRLGADDEFWIILSTGLRRLAQATTRSRPAAARRLGQALVTLAEELSSPRRDGNDEEIEETSDRPVEVAEALAQFPDPAHAAALVSRIRSVASDAEEAGALGLAREILTDLHDIAPHAPPIERGMVLLQLGRIARTVGDLEGAADYYSAMGDVGRATGTRELEVREAAAKAVVARTRGNYPAARDLFERALIGANELDLSEVAGLAHHGLMIVNGEAGDFDSALDHGWQALSAARNEAAREAEMLINLAQLCVKAGYDTAALGGFCAALAKTTVPRLRLPALAGTAEAAGRLGDRTRVEVADRFIEREVSDAFPFESSRAWFAVSRAKRGLGETAAADAAAEKAAVIAHAHGFYEITHYLQPDNRPAPASLTEVGRTVIKSLEAWSDGPVAEQSLSTSSTG
jgi:tetratricopeptide (TPR) repeat protein